MLLKDFSTLLKHAIYLESSLDKESADYKKLTSILNKEAVTDNIMQLIEFMKTKENARG